MNERERGTIKKWIPKGYGFLVSHAKDGDDIFFHISECNFNPEENMIVEFAQKFDERKQKYQAVDVRRVEENVKKVEEETNLTGEEIGVDQTIQKETGNSGSNTNPNKEAGI